MREIEVEELLFKKYYKSLCYFAWQMLHDTQAAEDVVQDAFVSYFKRKKDVSTDESAIRQFLYTSVKFSCYNRSRRNKVDAKYQSSLPKIEQFYEQDIEFRIIKAEVLTEVYQIVSSMPESCRKIFELGYLQDLSVKEIADELGISVSTVKTQRQRALKLIINKLNPEYFAVFLLNFPF